MEICVSRASLSVFALLLLVCTAQATKNYLAFPRMGRSNYLAFPRMGRSQGGAVSDSCCHLGLRNEYAIGPDGKGEELAQFCAHSTCCDGLTETVLVRATGLFYSACLPEGSEQSAHTSRVLDSLKTLLRRK